MIKLKSHFLAVASPSWPLLQDNCKSSSNLDEILIMHGLEWGSRESLIDESSCYVILDQLVKMIRAEYQDFIIVIDSIKIKLLIPARELIGNNILFCLNSQAESARLTADCIAHVVLNLCFVRIPLEKNDNTLHLTTVCKVEDISGHSNILRAIATEFSFFRLENEKK